MPDTLNDTLQVLPEEPSYPGHTQDLGEIHSRVQQVVITAICTTNLTIGLQHIPADLHVVVKTDSAECQMGNKPVHVYEAVVKWTKSILLYVVLNLIFSVQIEKHSRPFKEKSSTHLRSPSENYWIIAKIQVLTSLNMDALALRMDARHQLLARYHGTQNSRDLDQSINHFEYVLDICPMDHPCRLAALFNLATIQFMPLIDHPDQTVTQFHLAIALLSRSVKQGFQADADAAQELLNKVLNVCHANSHIYRAALIAVETSALHSAGSIGANDLGQEQPTTSMLPLSLNQLAHQTELCLQRDEPPP
ncbi:hypothetical protein DFJ58DRAFT_733147 [Suillus subalutaceus]|uniref:uncharacterized protein n=1 Tax=Suillus subalutaceus TaxID=48586 RepID=UPI001B869CEA|nr:uncharacterized protein DFJ58DRAFT_733147 [Suillus subalutaceus]KAG1839807.1 hypothetical protein DFJ58DRAFT_733147 [Suillus subalutaceus]